MPDCITSVPHSLITAMHMPAHHRRLGTHESEFAAGLMGFSGGCCRRTHHTCSFVRTFRASRTCPNDPVPMSCTVTSRQKINPCVPSSHKHWKPSAFLVQCNRRGHHCCAAGWAQVTRSLAWRHKGCACSCNVWAGRMLGLLSDDDMFKQGLTICLLLTTAVCRAPAGVAPRTARH